MNENEDALTRKAAERDAIAQIVKDVSVKWGGPSMAEFADTPPIRKHYATADAILAKGFHRVEDDERIEAWHYVADHEAFKACYVEEQPLIDSVLARITQLHELESTVSELAPAPENPGKPSGQEVEADVDRDYLAQVIHKAVYSRIPFDRLTDDAQADTYKRADAVLAALRASRAIR